MARKPLPRWQIVFLLWVPVFILWTFGTTALFLGVDGFDWTGWVLIALSLAAIILVWWYQRTSTKSD